MKIVVFDMDNIRNPHWGSGQAVATREIFKRLSARHEVTVYSSKYPNAKDYIEEGICYKHVGLGTNKSFLNNLAYIAVLPFLVRKIQADIIVEHFTAPFSLCFTPLFTRIPVIGLSSFFDSKILGQKYHLPFEIVPKKGAKYYRFFIGIICRTAPSSYN